jgi:Zn-dependent peptidase ImmA (M78 family)
VVQLCAVAGVAVVFVPELSKTRTSGATRWLSSNKAVIQLSLRYKTDDHLWFTFFHEAGHILRHGKRHGKHHVFLEFKGNQRDKEEEEADVFAADLLIPPDAWKRFLASGRERQSITGIQQFALEIGIAPGIVVGRLQHHEKVLSPRNCNDLKRKLKWAFDE